MAVKIPTLGIVISWFAIVLASGSRAGVEQVWPWNAMLNEKLYRATIEKAFPGLDYGFYHVSAASYILLQDFDRNRVLLLCPEIGEDNATITRNGKNLRMSDLAPFALKIARQFTTIDGKTESRFDHWSEWHAGYWIPLEITDQFSISIRTNPPLLDTFSATYDPEHAWRTTLVFKGRQRDRPPADVYEISRKPLVDQIIKALAAKAECTLRMASAPDLTLTKWDPQIDFDIEPFMISLEVESISIGTQQHTRVVTLPELDRALEMYRAGAMASGSVGRLLLRSGKGPVDPQFRALLPFLSNHRFQSLYFEVEP
jgi:hypothetical protein